MQRIRDYPFVLFDFDGLLVDTEPLHFEAYQVMCRARGFVLDWDLKKFCSIAHAKSLGMRDGLYTEFPALQAMEPSWDVLYQEKKDIYEQMLQSGRLKLMPGADRLLTALDEVGSSSRCVVTNSPLKHIEIIRNAIPVLQTIPLWLTRESYENPKPAPDGYLKALEIMGARPEEAIGFEDSLKGLQSLHAAGIQKVLICPDDTSHRQEYAFLKPLHFVSLAEAMLSAF